MGVINKALFDHHGEFMFTRLIASGTNTNPWMSEAHDKVIQPGDLVGLTPIQMLMRDMWWIFPGPSCVVISPVKVRRKLYRIAYDCVNGMRELMKPGMTFEEFGHAGAKVAARENRNGRYGAMAHQAGLEDEGPGIPYPDDDRRGGLGRYISPTEPSQKNMVFCLEC
ncbi:MAG: hypothetical protein CM1200mP39_25330 [Dehalococcoidia bacterium]|nr:MAG: hypothetical protein CM1200mP39_25330 [Dehalococcoidia bacterium]